MDTWKQHHEINKKTRFLGETWFLEDQREILRGNPTRAVISLPKFHLPSLWFQSAMNIRR